MDWPSCFVLQGVALDGHSLTNQVHRICVRDTPREEGEKNCCQLKTVLWQRHREFKFRVPWQYKVSSCFGFGILSLNLEYCSERIEFKHVLLPLSGSLLLTITIQT